MTAPVPRRGDHDELASSWLAAAVPGAYDLLEVLQELRRWTDDAMTCETEPPIFGSLEWCRLPDGPTKTYAAVRAAMAWWTEQWARADDAARDHVQASHAIAARADWAQASRDLLTGTRASNYIPRRE